jgi:hypothetical protein
MAIHNTGADSANTAVRAFTKVCELCLDKGFNTGNGWGKKAWEKIRDQVFGGECAYCGAKATDLTIEHLVMFNKTEFGLHHPGNIIPACRPCNKRTKRPDGSYASWEEHLRDVCRQKSDMASFTLRLDKIRKHHAEGEFKYPDLSYEEKEAIRVIAGSLYTNI